MEIVKETLVILIATPIYFLVIGTEILLSNYQHRQLYTLRDTVNNFFMMLLNAGIDLAFRSIYLVVLIFAYQHKIFEWSNMVLYWLALLLAEDFLFYWLHRMEHMVRIFWAVHVTHHSSNQYNFTVGFRSSVLQPLYRFVFFLPLAWLGFAPLDILFVFAATQTWGIIVHTKLIKKLGWLEHVLVTPSHHRVHHASNARYLDKNMGMLLIIWDKMFGTFQPELDETAYQPLHYGLTSPIAEHTPPLQLVLHEWKAIAQDIQQPLPWQIRLKYLLAPPGWSHDGSRKTSKQWRAQEASSHQQRLS